MDQKPLQLILARSLLTNLSTPGFLVDEVGNLVFFNDAAGEFLGRRFEETGQMTPKQWIEAFGPFDPVADWTTVDELPLTAALRRGRPAHERMYIRTGDGERTAIEATATPLMADEGSRGALVIFWRREEGQQ